MIRWSMVNGEWGIVNGEWVADIWQPKYASNLYSIMIYFFWQFFVSAQNSKLRTTFPQTGNYSPITNVNITLYKARTTKARSQITGTNFRKQISEKQNAAS